VAGKTKELIVLPYGPDGLIVTVEGEINTAFSNSFNTKLERPALLVYLTTYSSTVNLLVCPVKLAEFS
jgi:hypothetical protein